jgi:aspartate racemase
MSRASLTVGVLGGMGPAATVDFMAKVLTSSQGRRDQDGVRLIVDNNPGVPDRNAAVAGTGPSPAPVLAGMAQGLERAGAQFLVMVCNAAHAFEAEVRQATTLPFVSIVEETCAEVLRGQRDVRRVGVLAAAGALDARLYETAFARHGVEVLVPTGDARQQFMRLLYRIKAGDLGPEVRARMKACADELALRGAESIVAGCTEVPLVLSRHELAMPLVNSTDVLAKRTVAYARGNKRLPLRPPG